VSLKIQLILIDKNIQNIKLIMNNEIKKNQNLPLDAKEHIAEPENSIPPTNINVLPDTLKNAAKRAGWNDLMPVQAKAIPYILARRDLMVQSHTGSGKTGAFVLPLLEIIEPDKKTCQALILVPTRELASQVSREAELLAGDAGVKTVAVYGGTGYESQIKAFKNGAHIVVGTPGRVLDHLMKKYLLLDDLKIIIMDEADRMLSMGFYQDMKRVQFYLPRKRINAYMFSATFPPRVMSLAGEFLEQPDVLSLSRDHVHVTAIEHEFYNVPAVTKDRSLIKIIELENPDSAIIFCNRKSEVNYVNIVLKRYGYDSDELSSDLSQSRREKVLAKIRKGNLKFLVATDVAARGIDLPNLSHVFQYAPPEDVEIYIHRAGRTGRAGASGKAILLIAGTEKFKLDEIGKNYNIDFLEQELPTEEDVQKIVGERTVALLEAKLRGLDRMRVERMQRFIPLAKQLSESVDELSVVAMLLDEYYQEILHAPIPPVEEKTNGSEKSKKSGKPYKRPRKNPRH